MVAGRALECANIAKDRPEGLRCERHRPIAVRTSWCRHEDRSELTGGEISQRERGQPRKVPNTHQKDHLPLFPCPKRTFRNSPLTRPSGPSGTLKPSTNSCRNSIGYRATLAFALRLPTGPGIPMQVVVPSVSLAATLQPTELLRSVSKRRLRQPCSSQCPTPKSADLRLGAQHRRLAASWLAAVRQCQVAFAAPRTPPRKRVRATPQRKERLIALKPPCSETMNSNAKGFPRAPKRRLFY